MRYIFEDGKNIVE